MSQTTSRLNDIYFRVKAKDYGPVGESELNELIKAGRVPFSAWVYKDDAWSLLAETPALRELHPEYDAKPKAAPQKNKAKSAENLEANIYTGGTGATVSAEPVWFVIRDKKKHGPFSSADIVSQLQRKQLETSAFVWRPGFSTWQRMSQVPEFSRDSLKRLAVDSTGVDVIVKRKYTRAPYEVEVIAHDNTRAIEGKTMVIGEGGLFLATPRPTHKIGARLKLHFREGDTPSFNAVAEVVSVVRGQTPGYCMRFVALSDSDRRRISKFVSERRP